MKTNKFYLLLATFMVCATSVFISCSSDDDDNNNSKELGDKAVEDLKIRVLDEDGNVIFGETNDQGFYEIGIEKQEDAQKLVSVYAKNYNGGANYTYTLPDTRGTVHVDKANEEGVHYNLEIRVKGIPEMKLQVVEPNFMEGENKIYSVASYKCNESNCGKEFTLPTLAAKKCTFCSSSNVRKKTK